MQLGKVDCVGPTKEQVYAFYFKGIDSVLILLIHWPFWSYELLACSFVPPQKTSKSKTEENKNKRLEQNMDKIYIL